MKKGTCGGCGTKTTSFKGYCQRCQVLMRRGVKLAKEKEILVDFAGGSAWAWNKKGDVVAGPASSKGPVWIAISMMEEAS